ncbi:3'-5' exonuclease [Hufsiella ginkgonis]|uniref:DNA polymerase III subunit epsilon n=1 Tax=Hufsiella ginkgonis TaxID=2695274 RepID=A0A7K1XWG9_9SPHI|nr:3'-5' exonuclease [Hufsiella ginkgonis]MXV15321.1 DNA polymerase III subunit epsilon [Hufsiella ginkgonis]
MKLNLKRPLAFFDLEATGVNVASDRIVEISILKAMPDGTEQIKTMRINPEIPIPLEVSLIHGIYDEDIKDAPTFKEAGEELARFLDDADLAGYNSNKFDIPMLLEEFLRARIDFDLENRRFVDVQNIFHQMEQRTLKAAYQFYCGKSIENAHSAEADIKATYEVLLAQLDKYKETEFEDKKGNKSFPVQNDVEALHKFTNLNRPVDFAARMVYNEEGDELINFGKHKGRRVEEVFDAEPSYYAWMKQGDFPLYTKRCLEKIWVRWNEKKVVIRKTTETVTKIEREPAQGQRSFQKPQKPAKPEEITPVTDDMLAQLKMKFGK